jgi:hypothetical protein
MTGAAAPLWLKEFGEDFAVPSDMPAGFEDVSWHNDACPSFHLRDGSLKLWVDHPDPEQFA